MRRIPLYVLMLVGGPVMAQPPGWSYRLEKPTDSIANVKFVVMEPGFHFTTGREAGIYWRETDATTGSFHAVATFHQTKAPTHPEAFGLFVAGKDLNGPNASYIYLIVRGTGEYSIRKGGAAGAPSTDLTQGGGRNGWLANAAVVKQDSTGKAANRLEIAGDARTNKLTFKVNGTMVQELDVPEGVTGLIGIRMNHGLDVHVTGFAVHKM